MSWKHVWCGVMSASMMACGGSQGTISSPLEADLSAFSELKQVFNAVKPDGQTREMTLDGKEGEVVVAAPYTILAATPDGRVLVLGDSETNLFIQKRGEDPVRVPELDGRTQGAAISADGTRVAASKHADYSTPQSSWDDIDDAVYIVDVQAKSVRVVPPTRQGQVYALSWSGSDELIYNVRSKEGEEWYSLDVESETRQVVAYEDVQAVHASRRAWMARPDECGGARVSADDGGVFLGEPESPQYIVQIEGRKRGFHDYMSTIESVHFLQGCDYVLFSHNQKAVRAQNLSWQDR